MARRKHGKRTHLSIDELEHKYVRVVLFLSELVDRFHGGDMSLDVAALRKRDDDPHGIDYFTRIEPGIAGDVMRFRTQPPDELRGPVQ